MVRQKQLQKALALALLPVSDYKRVYKFVFHCHQLPHGAQTLVKGQLWHEFSSIWTIHNV